MQAIEFKTKISNNTIELPREFENLTDCFVKVIVLIEEDNISMKSNYVFDAISINTKDFHFNREEANER